MSYTSAAYALLKTWSKDHLLCAMARLQLIQDTTRAAALARVWNAYHHNRTKRLHDD